MFIFSKYCQVFQSALTMVLNKKMIRAILTFSFLWASVFSVKAQSISNITATVEEELIRITYDLKGNKDVNEFTIRVYNSLDNFNKPLKLVYGHVGDKVTSGDGRSITWAAKTELKDYKGPVQFEVRGEPIVLIKPLAFGSPVTGSSVKRGKNLTISWTGGARTEAVQLQLMQDGTVKHDLGKQPNTGQYEWTVPKNTPKGTYQLFMASSNGSTLSMPFSVKPKTAAFLKILPILVAGGVVYFLTGSESSPDSPAAGNKLPIPPDPN